MPNPAILVVGAGALGVVTGYHLALAGADITFLVRPNRLAALEGGLKLYCFDDLSIKDFQSYSSVSSPEELAGKQYDFVLVTLDGATCRSAEGEALLRSLGDAIRQGKAVALICGMDVREHCREVMGLPEERVMEGTQAMLSYQVDRAQMPAHPPADPAQVASTDFAYRHMGQGFGFTVVDEPQGPAREFIALYDSCGVSKCRSMKRVTYTMLTRSFFPMIAVWERAGWPDAKTLASNRELMELGSRAMAEIIALPEHGWRGKLTSLFIGHKTMAKKLVEMERECLPLDYTAFNHFHHAGKVRAQNLLVMQRCAEAGKAAGKPMAALSELIESFAA